MEKGKATGPQRKLKAERVDEPPMVLRTDDRERKRVAYAATRARLEEASERLSEAFAAMPEASAAGNVDELPLGPLQSLERDLNAILVTAQQLADTV